MNFFDRQYSPRVAYLLVVVASTIWGLLWIPLRAITDYGLHPFFVNALFLLLPALTLGVFAHKTIKDNMHHLNKCVLTGLFLGAGFMFYSIGLITASVSKTTVLFYLTPVWATIFGLFFLDERFTMQRAIIVGVALAGCMMVMRLNPLNVVFEFADIYGFASGLFWGLGSICIRRYPEVHYIAITFWQYIVGTVVAIGAAFALGVSLPTGEAVMNALPLAYIVGAVIFMPTVLIIFRVSQYVSPGLVGVLMLSEVVFAVVSAWWLLGEVLTIWQWVGMIAILGTGTWLGLSADDEPVSEDGPIAPAS